VVQQKVTKATTAISQQGAHLSYNALVAIQAQQSKLIQVSESAAFVSFISNGQCASPCAGVTRCELGLKRCTTSEATSQNGQAIDPKTNKSVHPSGWRRISAS
jgi:hypothetical protein